MSKILSKGLTFDDVLLVPAYSEVTPDVVVRHRVISLLRMQNN